MHLPTSIIFSIYFEIPDKKHFAGCWSYEWNNVKICMPEQNLVTESPTRPNMMLTEYP